MEGFLTIIGIVVIALTVISALQGDKGSQRHLKIMGMRVLIVVGLVILLFVIGSILSPFKDNDVIHTLILIEVMLVFPIIGIAIVEAISCFSYNNNIFRPEYYFKTRTYFIENPERFLYTEMYQNLIQQKIIKSVQFLESRSSVLLRSKYGKYEISLNGANSILLSAEISLWRRAAEGGTSTLSPTVWGFHQTFSVLEYFFQFMDYTPILNQFRKGYRRDTIRYGIIILAGILLLFTTLTAVGIGTAQVYSEINLLENEEINLSGKEDAKINFVKNLRVEQLGYTNCQDITVSDVLEACFFLTNWEYEEKDGVEIVEAMSIFIDEGREKTCQIQFVLLDKGKYCRLLFLALDNISYDPAEGFQALIDFYKNN